MSEGLSVSDSTSTPFKDCLEEFRFPRPFSDEASGPSRDQGAWGFLGLKASKKTPPFQGLGGCWEFWASTSVSMACAKHIKVHRIMHLRLTCTLFV